MSDVPQSERDTEKAEGLEAGVPADLLNLYIDCDLLAQERGVDVDVVLAEIRGLAGEDQ